MLAEQTRTAPAIGHKHHLAFFRQSGWLMVATTVMGGLMYAVHMIACRMPKEEYSLFLTLLQIMTLIGIPTVGLQGVFAQQAAAALNPEHEKELAGLFRGVLRGTFGLWLLTAGGIFLFRHTIMGKLGITNPAGLWVTVLIGLAALWRPLVQGVLQGRQNFMWLGGVLISEGVMRFGAVWVIVGLLGNYAAGGMAAVLLGIILLMVAGGWFCRDCLTGDAAPVDWVAWLKRVLPLSLGMGAGIFMLAADMIFVRRYFPEKDSGYYGAAGMIGRALVYFTAPLTSVMFPKLVRSAALGEKSSALMLALGVTALAGGGAALVCSLFPSLPLRIVYDASFLEVSTPLVPWFVWCMLPLTLANVLLNSLMAHSRFNAVPWLVAVAAGYGVTLYLRHENFIQVIQTIGIFGTLLLGVCAWFTLRSPRSRVQSPRSAA